MPEPDCFLRYRVRCNAEFYYVGKIPRKIKTILKFKIILKPRVAAATRGFRMVLFTASRGNNFVGGTCAPPSALLVLFEPKYFPTRGRYGLGEDLVRQLNHR